MKRTPQDYINEPASHFKNAIMNSFLLSIGKLNSLVVPRIQLMGLMFKNINLRLIFEMTSEFNIQIINSLSHS